MKRGSTLGGLLFLVYDYPHGRLQEDPVVYVNDNLELASKKYNEELQNNIQEQADITTNWLEMNKM